MNKLLHVWLRLQLFVDLPRPNGLHYKIGNFLADDGFFPRSPVNPWPEALASKSLASLRSFFTKWLSRIWCIRKEREIYKITIDAAKACQFTSQAGNYYHFAVLPCV